MSLGYLFSFGFGAACALACVWLFVVLAGRGD